MLILLYNIPYSLATSSLIECDFDSDKTLTLNQYSNIMRQVYNIDLNILSKRIEAFEKYMIQDIAVITCLDLYNNYYNIIEILNEALDLSKTYSLETIKLYDKNNDGNLTFLEFNKFINDVVEKKISN